MIELVSLSRCVRCDLCFGVCPMDVFDRAEDGLPVIARKADCQTCFLCEAHCPTDALYVAAERRPAPTPSEAELAERQLLGSYRARLGWGKGRRPPRSFDEALALSQRPEAAAGVSPAGAQPGAQPRKEAYHG